MPVTGNTTNPSGSREEFFGSIIKQKKVGALNKKHPLVDFSIYILPQIQIKKSLYHFGYKLYSIKLKTFIARGRYFPCDINN